MAALGKLQSVATVSIEVAADKAEALKVLSNASANALRILAEASKKPGMETKLILAKTLGQL